MRPITLICAWLSARVGGLGGIIKSMLTGPDGSSWAPGRVMGLAVFMVGQGLVLRAARAVLVGRPSIADWCAFFSGVSTFEAAISATAIGLVLGMAPTDAGGKWWGREASPPPPPSAPAPR
jgi:hypothetical protein